MPGLDCGGGGGEPLVDRQARAARPQRPILQRIGRAEQRHYSVAGEILDRAALLPHRAGHQFIDRLDQSKRALLAEPFGDRGEADHVREQRRHLPPLARRRSQVHGMARGVGHVNAPQAD
jgi:hypothetical protein